MQTLLLCTSWCCQRSSGKQIISQTYWELASIDEVNLNVTYITDMFYK